LVGVGSLVLVLSPPTTAVCESKNIRLR
jgi:hypothetical protein